MNIQNIILYVFLFAAAASAIGILFTRNVFKAALLLLSCLLSVAALYVFAFAEFLAVAQIMIYAGGIVVVIIFGIMLTTKISGTALKVENSHLFAGLTGSGIMLFLLLKYLNEVFDIEESAVRFQNPVTETGMNLMTGYVLPFEVAGLLLLAALIGAAVISSEKPKNT